MANNLYRIWNHYRFSSMLMKLIYFNIAVFLLLRIIAVVANLSGHNEWLAEILAQVQMPSDINVFLRHPWTVVTYMFAQFDVLHILFNMLWLYWFGVMFLNVATQRNLFALYLYGGIGGAMLYLLAYNTLPGLAGINSSLIGASGAVIAIVVATAVIMPDHKIGLLFIGSVSLKWVAIVTIGIDLISVTGVNSGGHISHIGGAAIGAIYALSRQRGIDITRPVNKVFDMIANFISKTATAFSRKKTTKQPQTRASASSDDNKTLDIILDKIKKSGYSSLTAEERKILFEVSSRIK